MEEKEWLIERFYDGEQLKIDRKNAFQHALEMWGFTKIAEELRQLSTVAEPAWLPIWAHVSALPNEHYEYGTGWYRSRAALLLPVISNRTAQLCVRHKKVSPVTLDRAIELWGEARSVLGRTAHMRIRNIKTGEILAWECFE